MKCVVCRHGETIDGFATVTIERDALTFVVKQVPARVCSNCGEEFVDESIAAELFKSAGEISKSGAELDVRHYLKAA
jgi:YgiT-type zinc finger domain-containing protein